MHKSLTISLIATGSLFLFACDSNSQPNATASKNALANQGYNTETIIQAKTNTLKNEDIELTLEQIMSDPDWLGRQPQSPFYSPLGDSKLYYRKREGSVVRDLFEIEQNNGNGNLVALDAMHEHRFEQLIDDEDSSFVAWIFEGNIFAQSKATKVVTQLTKSSQSAFNLQFFNDDSVSYQIGNAFYTTNATTGKTEQVLEWVFGTPYKPVKPAKDYVAQEQQELVKYVQVQQQNRRDHHQQQKALMAENSSIQSNKFYFKKGHSTVVASLSPNGKYAIVVTRKQRADRDDTDIMPHYIQEDGRIAAKQVRQRVADGKPESHSIYFIDVEKKSSKLLSYKSLPGYNEDVLASVKKENAEAKGEKYEVNRLPRDIGLLFDWYATEQPVKWHDSSQYAALMLEAWDNKDRWIVTVNAEKPALVNQHRMHDDAWVNYRHNEFSWFDNELKLFYLSEHSGYSQLYTKAIDGKEKQITQGRFVVESVTLTKNDEYFYFRANVKHPGIYEIYRVPTSGGELQELTNLNGNTSYVLSPNENELLLTHSTLAMPPELYAIDVNSDQAPVRLTNTVSDAFLSIDWIVPKIVAIKSSHTDQPIYSRVYMSDDVTSPEKRRAVVFNHGAGYLQNSHLGWSNYFREFMFHTLLVSQGYVVLDMDYRASAGYGRDWRTAIYRQMGKPEVEDLVDGVNWLVENANVDRNRIGTYGGSYGGFLTFMSLFTEPDLFQAGAALRPVSDWAHYNLPYTSNILNMPDVDPIAYERSSPIYFAEGLTKPLLINAPMVDDNVFFVDVVRLVQRLIELEKQNFETAIYPVEPHGFVQPSSWLDEYRRIYKLFETNL